MLTHQPEGQLQEQHQHMLRDNTCTHYLQYKYVGHRKEDFKDILKMKRQIHADKYEDCGIRCILQEKCMKEI